MAFKNITKFSEEEKITKTGGLLSPRSPSNSNNNEGTLRKLLRGRKTRSISDLRAISPIDSPHQSHSPTPPTSSPCTTTSPLSFSPVSLSPNSSSEVSPILVINGSTKKVSSLPTPNSHSNHVNHNNYNTYTPSTISLASISSPEDNEILYVRKLLKKLIMEERNFVHGVGGVVQGYLAKLNPDLISQENRDIIFNNIEEIYHFHISLRPELDNLLKKWPKIKLSDLFFSISHIVQTAYLNYVSNLPRATSLLDNLTKQSKVFSSFLKNCENQHCIPPLATLITFPVDRIDSYLDFLQQFIERFKNNLTEDYVDEKEKTALNEVAELIEDFSQSFHTRENIANSMHTIMEITHLLDGLDENLVRPGRRLIREGPIATTTNDNLKPISDYAHLFNDVIVFSKLKGKKPKDGFIFASKLWLYKLTLKDVKGDSLDNEFGITCGKSSYRIVANTLSEKDEWVLVISIQIREVEKTKKVFGVPLKLLSQRENNAEIPTFLTKSVLFINENGMDREGIFRQTGRSTQVQHLKDLYNQGKKVFFNTDLNPHSVAELIKLWLCELPEPIIPWEIFQDYQKLKGLGEDILIQELNKSVHEKTNRYSKHVLQHVMKMVFRISQRQEANKMPVSNLATVFAPCLLFYDESNTKDPREIAGVYKNMQEFVACLITNYRSFFSNIEEERKLRQQNSFEEAIVVARGSRIEKRRNNRLSLTLNTESDVHILQTLEKDLQQKALASQVSLHLRPNSSSSSFRDPPGQRQALMGLGVSPLKSRRSIEISSFISKEGWLKKKSAKNFSGGWSVLWFVLKYKSLSYFSAKEDVRPKGVIVLRGCVAGRDSVSENCFYLNFSNRRYLMVARDEKDRSEWLRAIRDCTENETGPYSLPDQALYCWDPRK
eukprot:TRINITY_DN8069_c0_g1_i1.p1 TRINITY_DN8069_c0_g1~~TRINITY_DN8069_c0_g1_i1.p1  ORF type:complete len:890 (+),score=172.81 TRINITY_DN8069_c0_g1_i1:113-2782(+)